jgi:hypothetical protein
MHNHYMRLGRRIALPPTVQILDELNPDYRSRLVREKRQRRNPPRAIALPALTPAALRKTRPSWQS